MLDWIIKGGYTWGVELLHDVPVSTISELQAKGLNIILYQLSHPETVQRYYTQKNRAIPDVELTVNQFKKATSGNFVWQHILEDESCGVGLAQEFLSLKPTTHREAYEMTEKYFRKSIQASQNQDKIPHWAVAGFANTAHILAKQPEIALLSIERANDDVDDLQTGVSFLEVRLGNMEKCGVLIYHYGGAPSMVVFKIFRIFITNVIYMFRGSRGPNIFE